MSRCRVPMLPDEAFLDHLQYCTNCWIRVLSVSRVQLVHFSMRGFMHTEDAEEWVWEKIKRANADSLLSLRIECFCEHNYTVR